MPYSVRTCTRCSGPWYPNDRRSLERGTCGECAGTAKHLLGDQSARRPAYNMFEPAGAAQETTWVPGAVLVCPVCLGRFTQKEPLQTTHKACKGRVNRGVAKSFAEVPTPYKDAGYTPGGPLPKYRPVPPGIFAPLKVAVMDLETFGLDRGWGVLLVGVIDMFGDGEAKEYRYRLDQFETYKHDRSDDSEIGAAVMAVLEEAHVIYAHNGKWFDLPWLNSIAMRYELPPLDKKLRDPVQILRAKMRIGSNSLEAAAQFLGLDREKLHVPREVWRQAAFNGSKEDFDILEERCASDVHLLAEVASRVEAWGGQIEYSGFYRR